MTTDDDKAGGVATPMTDKCEYNYYNPPIATPSRVDDVFKHARQLERKLIHLQQELSDAREAMAKYLGERNELQKELQKYRDGFYEEMLSRRDLTPENACLSCGGFGVRVYGSTATWRGGIGGQALTNDVCDKCWGSGHRHYKWPSHR